MATKTSEQMTCPYPGDSYRTPSCETKQAAAAWLIEHMIDSHPGGLPPVVVTAVKGVTSKFK